MNLYDCKILLIDDNEELVSMIRGILKRAGLRIYIRQETAAAGWKCF